MPATLALPAGQVQVSDGDRIYAIAGWVVAVGMGPDVFIVARQRHQSRYVPPLREQLTGYLVGRGGAVVRTDIRFPWQWQQFGTLDSTVRYWMKHFLEEGTKRRLLVALPPRLAPPIWIPLGEDAEGAVDFWDDVLLLANALAQDNPESMNRIRPQLWEVAHAWETQWNANIAHTSKQSTVSQTDWDAVQAADRAWANVVREHLEPHGFVMAPDSMARLL